MEHTTKAAQGSYNHQSQQTTAIPRPTAPFFHSWRVLSNIGKWAIVRQGEPTIVVAVSQNIAGVHGTHHKGNTEGSQNHQSQQTSAIPRPNAHLLHAWRVLSNIGRRVLSNIGKWAIVRQGEPTIVVAVSQNIAG